MSDDKKTSVGSRSTVDESIKSESQPIKQEKASDRPKPVTPPPKKK